MNQWLSLVLLIGLVMFGILGCGTNNQSDNNADNDASNDTPTANWADYENKIQRPLFDVAASKTPAEAAERLSISQHLMAHVVIELQPGTTLPVGFLVLVENETENLIQAWVRTDQLLELSKREEVRFIRSPARPTNR